MKSIPLGTPLLIAQCAVEFFGTVPVGFVVLNLEKLQLITWRRSLSERDCVCVCVCVCVAGSKSNGTNCRSFTGFNVHFFQAFPQRRSKKIAHAQNIQRETTPRVVTRRVFGPQTHILLQTSAATVRTQVCQKKLSLTRHFKFLNNQKLSNHANI